MPFITASAYLLTPQGREAIWDVTANLLSRYPELDAQGIMVYSLVARNFSGKSGIKVPLDGFLATFILPGLHPENTSLSLTAVVSKLLSKATAAYPFQFMGGVIPQTYPDFWAWYNVSNGPLDAGYDQYLGSRLLDGKALTQNLTALKEAFKAATASGSGISAYLVGGHGVMNAKPRGGGNAVNPAWRRAYVHAGTYSGCI
jgi:hypothetical protein